MKKTTKQLIEEFEVHYVRTLTVPTATDIPAGHVLVHNHIRHTARTRSADRGFRAWTQKPSDELEPCGCGWSGLPHYRIRKLYPPIDETEARARLKEQLRTLPVVHVEPMKKATG